MSALSTLSMPSPATQPHPCSSHDFHIARQPIVARDGSLYGFELLFRDAGGAMPVLFDDVAATASVIAHVAELGMEQVLGPYVGFVNIDAAALFSDFLCLVPCERVIFELLETVQATPDVLDRMAALRQMGYAFALDDVILSSVDVQKLLPLVDIVKIDILGMAPEQIRLLLAQVKCQGRKVLAEKVETREQHALCLELGFDFFQGYFFSKPILLSGKKLSSSESAIVDILSLINANADNVAIENAVKRDGALMMQVLRLSNTAAVGARGGIESVSHSLLVLGRRQLKRWLQVLLYSSPLDAQACRSPLLAMAVNRARFLELLANTLHPARPQMGDMAFTVGIISLMDTLFSIPMAELLGAIGVNGAAQDALLRRTGFYGQILTLAEQLERGEPSPALMLQLELAPNVLHTVQQQAFVWSNGVLEAS